MTEPHTGAGGSTDARCSPRDTPELPGRLQRLRDDQRRRWQRGERPRVEDYLAQDPELRADEELLVELIGHEFLLAEELGESPCWDAYRRRFPQCAPKLRLWEELYRDLADSRARQTLATAGGEIEQGPREVLDPAGTQVAPPDSTGPGPGAVSGLLRRWQELKDEGVTLTAEELCRECPEHRAEVEARLRALAALYGMLDMRHPVGEAKESARPPAPRVPGYEVLGELGRGGMGVVYKARQVRLNRTVASR